MKHYLVLGATGAIGYAFTQELLKNHCLITILVRDEAKAKKLFSNHPLLTIVTGDAHDASLLKKLCDGKDVVFHGINYPYSQWVEKMMDVTIKLTEAVEKAMLRYFFREIFMLLVKYQSLLLSKRPITLTVVRGT